MFRIRKVKALPHYKIWVKYSDGTEGEIDLSSLAGHGVFSIWKDVNVFNQVYVDSSTHTVAWNDQVDLCPDSLYMQITHKKPEDLFKTLKKAGPHA